MKNKIASYFTKANKTIVNCGLCPHNCKIEEGELGVCLVRKNINGELYAETYGKICSLNIDPIEKKPLYNFLPGNDILSVGTVGCNFKCGFCQNWEISTTGVENFPYLKEYQMTDLVDIAAKNKNSVGIAYTYNEPTVWFEMMRDTAKLAQTNGLKNVMVSNGFINPGPLKELFNYIDAFSIDLKAFTDEFYRKYTSARIEPVKKALQLISQEKKHLEVTSLIIPGLNDSKEEFKHMVEWIAQNLGEDTPFHISRYFPAYKFNIHPTPEDKLVELYEIAVKYLNYVYLGNTAISTGKDTFCNKCSKKVIERTGYSTRVTGLDDIGNCKFCGNNVIKTIK